MWALFVGVSDRLLNFLPALSLDVLARSVMEHLHAGSAAAPDLYASLFSQHPNRMQQLMKLAQTAGQQAKKAGDWQAAKQLFTHALQLLEQIALATAAAAAASNVRQSSDSSSSPPSPPPPLHLRLLCRPSACPASAVSSSTSGFSFFCIDPIAWRDWYDLTLSLYTELGSALLLTGELLAAEQIFEYAHTRVRSVLDLAPFFALNMSSLRQQNRLVEAVLCSLKHIEELGLSMTDQPAAELITFLQLPSPSPVTGASAGASSPDSVRSHPIFSLRPMTDPTILVSMQLLVSMVPMLTRLGSSVLTTVTHTLNDLTRRYGVCAESAIGIVLYGVVRWKDNDIQAAAYMARLALQMALRMEDKLVSVSRVHAIAATRIHPWTLPAKECAAITAATADELAQQGDLHSASFAASGWAVQVSLSGVSLGAVHAQLLHIWDRHLAWLSHMPALASTYLWLRLAQRLQMTGPAGDETELEWRAGERKTDVRLVEEMELDHNIQHAWSGWIALGIAAFYELQTQRALQQLQAAMNYVDKTPGFAEHGQSR